MSICNHLCLQSIKAQSIAAKKYENRCIFTQAAMIDMNQDPHST